MGSYKNERLHRMEHYDEIALASAKSVSGARAISS